MMFNECTMIYDDYKLYMCIVIIYIGVVCNWDVHVSCGQIPDKLHEMPDFVDCHVGWLIF